MGGPGSGRRGKDVDQANRAAAAKLQKHLWMKDQEKKAAHRAAKAAREIQKRRGK